MQAETRYENARHYYLRLYESDFNGREIPEVLVNRYQKKGFIECQTLDLMKLNERIQDSHNEIVLMSDKTVQELIENLRGEIPSLYQVCESIALLDMLAAFGHAATSSVSDYSRPDLTDCIGIKSGRHPVREKVCRLCMIGVFLLIISCFRCTGRNSYPMTFMRPSNLASRSSLAVT
jgi:DNA mismatch repair protein MSH4